MVRKLFILLFLTGIIPLITSVPRKFYLILQNKTWFEAQTYCQTNHYDLVSIESADDLIQLQTEAQKQQFSSRVWTGLYMDWFWTFRNEPLGSIRPWAVGLGEPNSLTEECGVISPWGLGNYPCPFPLTFVCFDDAVTGMQRFIHYSFALIWSEAQSYCREHHTDLATIRDSTEQANVVSMISTWTYIGLFRSPWKWSDKNNLSVSWLYPGQPAFAKGETHCAYIQSYINNVPAIDSLCSNKIPFFCYRVITGQQQIMRMKVQTDQDVNNPAVIAVVLEQIQQKMSALGIKNVMVKFRKQPDGKIFYKGKV